MEEKAQHFDEPFAMLADLAERSVRIARGLPGQIEIKPHWSGVGFYLAGMRMVAPMGEVAEMLSMPAFARLPGVKPWVVGVANTRGRLMPLVDLEAFYHGHLTSAKRQRRVLVLEVGNLYTGLVVNEVYGMQHFPVDTYTDAKIECAEILAPFMLGAFVHEEMVWPVFSPLRLSQDVNFINAALGDAR